MERSSGGESVQEALRRELIEELGFSPPEFRELIVVEHAYPDRRVRLHALSAQVGGNAAFRREDAGRCRWVAIEALGDVEWPAANAPITAALQERLRRGGG